MCFPLAARGLLTKKIRQPLMSQTPASLHSTQQMQTSNWGNFEGRKESHCPTPQLRRESPKREPPPLWMWHYCPGRGAGTPTPQGTTAIAGGGGYIAALIYCSWQKGALPSPACLVRQWCTVATALGPVASYVGWAEVRSQSCRDRKRQDRLA